MRERERGRERRKELERERQVVFMLVLHFVIVECFIHSNQCGGKVSVIPFVSFASLKSTTACCTGT